MYISKLVLYGFKSFLKRTEIEFGRGITAIVGPNGCGKTNIIDAIRWVIGEQKASILRSDRITDVIFNGTATRRPLNMSEVSLVIHNVSGRIPIAYTDIEITRRLYRNGESEYFINRNLCRLKDITDLFLDTGMGANAYSIIELKMIEDLLSETPEERKRLFEEAAGVNKYRLQRKAALRKLEATRDDLVRLNDIINEVENSVKNLKRHLQRYEKYQEITQKLIEAEVQLASRRIFDLRQKYLPLQEQISAKQTRLNWVNENLQQLETEFQQKNTQWHSQEEILENKRRELEAATGSLNQSKTEGLLLNEQLRHHRQNLSKLENNIASLRSNRESSLKRQEQIGQEINELQTLLESKRATFKQLAGESESVLQQNRIITAEIQQLQDERFNLMRAQAEQTARQNSLKENIQHRQNELKALKQQINNLTEQQSALNQKATDQQSRLTALKEQLSVSKKQLADAEQQQNDFEAKQNKLREEIRKIDSELDRLSNRVQFYSSIIQSKEGFGPGLQYVLDHLPEFPGIRGALSDLIAVEPRYYLAVEAVLKDISRLLIADDQSAALTAIAKLSIQQKGRVSIIPLDANFQNNNPKPPDNQSLEPLVKFLQCTRELEHLKDFLFQNVYCCPDEDFDELVRNRQLKNISIVSDKGRFRDGSGIFSGGGETTEAQLLIGRNQRLASYEKEYARAREQRAELQQKLNQVQQEINTLAKLRQTTQAENNRLTQAINRLTEEIQTQQTSLLQINSRLQSLNEQKVAIQAMIESFTEKLQKELPVEGQTSEKVAHIDELLEQKKAFLLQIKNQFDEWNNRSQNARIELINLENRYRNLSDSRTALISNLQYTEKQLQQTETEKVTLQTTITQLEQQLSQNAQQTEQLSQTVNQLNTEYFSLQTEFQSTRQSLDELNQKINVLRNEKEQIIQELKTLELDKSAYLATEREISTVLMQKYNRQVTAELNADLPSEAEAIQSVERQKHQLELIGTVNMAVKEEHEQEKARLDFLTEQRDDLLESEKGLNEVIGQIDKIAREQYLEIFEKIRTNFKATFDIFFGGGEADLKMIGDPDPLESEIEIWACPGGKKMRTLKMLSAGEKALTAIALLFAIYQVKPSPFCILDEVDAPLDDENTRRFLNVIKTFAEKTQFIIVTHNKSTMAIADTLYGVTMAEKGVSQIVSVKLE